MFERYLREYRRLPGCTDEPDRIIVVRIATQTLTLWSEPHNPVEYRVSTARNGAGCLEGSGCTPIGWHRIAEKIGTGESTGQIFVGRCAIDGIATDLHSTDDDDLITSRILWLEGLQPDVNSGGNVDSKRRYIYIHGTAQEHLLGTAVSHGCVRLSNQDVIDLYDRVQPADPVLIED